MAVDLGALRAEVAAVCTAAGYPGWSFVPNDVQVFPAAVVNPPEEVLYDRTFSGMTATVILAISVAVSFESEEDAQRRLDAAMSVGVAGSLVDAFRLHRLGTLPGLAGTPVNWSDVEFMRSGTTRLVAAGSSTGKALATDLTLKFMA